jgi:hypothetical protein
MERRLFTLLSCQKLSFKDPECYGKIMVTPNLRPARTLKTVLSTIVYQFSAFISLHSEVSRETLQYATPGTFKN